MFFSAKESKLYITGASLMVVASMYCIDVKFYVPTVKMNFSRYLVRCRAKSLPGRIDSGCVDGRVKRALMPGNNVTLW